MININFMPKLAESGNSRYSLVVAVAKRAREITEEASEHHEKDKKYVLVEKPVSLAAEEFLDGAFDIVPPSDNNKSTDQAAFADEAAAE